MPGLLSRRHVSMVSPEFPGAWGVPSPEDRVQAHIHNSDESTTARSPITFAAPEVAAATEPEIQAARRRLKEMLHDLQDRGFDKTSRKHMVYSSRKWTQGRSKGEAD